MQVTGTLQTDARILRTRRTPQI